MTLLIGLFVLMIVLILIGPAADLFEGDQDYTDWEKDDDE